MLNPAALTVGTVCAAELPTTDITPKAIRPYYVIYSTYMEL